MIIVNFSDLDVDKIYGNVDPYSAEGFEVFRLYCKLTNSFYYGRPREFFDKAEAVELAKANKAKLLILEDLS